jgi:hypothetical protein
MPHIGSHRFKPKPKPPKCPCGKPNDKGYDVGNTRLCDACFEDYLRRYARFEFRQEKSAALGYFVETRK